MNALTVREDANMGFPREERTECELEEWNNCKDLRERVGGTNWGAKCDNIDELFMDDDCLGHDSLEECNEATLPRNPPICDENTPPGVTCVDEGDFTDCEPGFIDRGYGCEPEVCVDIFPSICFPEHPSNIGNDNRNEERISPEMIDENDTPPVKVEEEEEEEESSDEEEEESEQEEESSQEEAEAIP